MFGFSTDSIQESHNLFREVLNRRETADATRVALQALLRHKFLFCLPNAVMRHAKKEEYDIVINDYARAKKLFGKSDIPVIDCDSLNMRIGTFTTVCNSFRIGVQEGSSGSR